MTQQECFGKFISETRRLQCGMRGSFRGSPSRAAVQRVIDRLHGLALGDRDIARDGDGGGDDDDGDDEARGIASAAGSPSAAATTSPTSAHLARVPPGAAVAALAAVKAAAPSVAALAYCPHVDGDLASAARAAGADAVWPRSRFATEVERVVVDGRLSPDAPLQ